MASRTAYRNYAHAHFWSAAELKDALGDVNHKGFRFCKDCWVDVTTIPKDITAVKHPGLTFVGCCSVGEKGKLSPGQMDRHMKKHHPLKVPAFASGDNDGPDAVYDHTLVEHAARDLVAEDLDSFSVLTRPGVKKFLAHLCPQKKLGGRKAVTAAFDRFKETTDEGMRKKVESAKRDYSRFALSADSWKTKGKKRRHYHAVFLSWANASWELEEICAGVVELQSPRNWAKYKEVTFKLLADIGVQPDDVWVAVSDHEGAIRKGLRMSGFQMLGCCCHGLQLPIKHVIPSKRPKKSERSKIHDDSSSSSSSSSVDGPERPEKVVENLADEANKLCEAEIEDLEERADGEVLAEGCR